MRIPSSLSAHAWLLAPLSACVMLVWANQQRAQRVEYVTNIEYGDAAVDPASPTGYADGKRWLIVPEHNSRSYQWIAETQQMFALAQWRVRYIDTENAPYGREVHSASPYRWWLGLVAWCEHKVSGRPLGLSVERASLWADPLLHLLLVIVSVCFSGRYFGAWPASLLAVGLVSLYPFAGSFLPGVPDDRGLSGILVLWSVLPLMAALRRTPPLTPARTLAKVCVDKANIPGWQAGPLFALAGVAGGLGLWVSTPAQTAIIVGITLGGILATWQSIRGKPTTPTILTENATPWHTWAVSGATTCLAAYLIEYFPGHLDFRLQVNHPMHGVAWFGLGELLVLNEKWSRHGQFAWTRIRLARLILALAAIAALPVATTLSGVPSLLFGEVTASRLSNLPNSVVAGSLAAWISRDGPTPVVVATCLSLLLLLPAVWLLIRRGTKVPALKTLSLALGPVMIALLFSMFQLAWWNLCGALILALIVAVTDTLCSQASSARSAWRWAGFTVLVFLPGLFLLRPLPTRADDFEFTRLEVEGLIERSLAHWLADHSSPAIPVVLAPPSRTISLCFYGGLRGLGTANWENSEGLAAAVKIVSATTFDEAKARLDQRGVTHIILPSWDQDLDEFARWSVAKPEDSFIMAMHRWALPPSLRPWPYPLPDIPGFKGRSVVILEVTDENNRASAVSRLAEYFLETKQLELAVAAAEVLQRYPADLGALVALTEVERRRGDRTAYDKAFAALLANLEGGHDRTLPWDRRVSLAVVLAQGHREDQSREQVKRCVETLTEARMRSLTTAALYRLLILSRTFGVPTTDPKLQDLGRKLLPAELRNRL